MWAPNDLVTDADLVAYETSILTTFGRADWRDRRQKALEDWLFPLVKSKGLNPHRLRTRYTPDAVLSYTAGAYTDRTSAAGSQTADDVPLASTFATPGTDYLYIGSTQPFRGVSVRMGSTVNAVDSVLAVAQWCDAWKTLAAVDGTVATSGKTFSGGGAVTWRSLPDWVVSQINGSSYYYWVRLGVSAGLTASTAAHQLGCIRRSALCACATFRTLELIFREAPTQQDGPWSDKADFYAQEAERSWLRVADQIGGEFDTDTEDDLIDSTEAAQTVETAGGRTATWERF